MPAALYGCLVGASALAALLSGLLVSQLLFFHFGLIYRGVTTYEFIVSQRQKASAHRSRQGETVICHFAHGLIAGAAPPHAPASARGLDHRKGRGGEMGIGRACARDRGVGWLRPSFLSCAPADV